MTDAHATVKSNEEKKDGTPTSPIGKPDGSKTERQTKTEFDSSKKKVGQITLHDPSHIKDQEEKVIKLKEEVDKHKREIEELEKKLMQNVIKQTKFEEHVERELAKLQRKVEGQEESVHHEIQEAIRTTSSFSKKAKETIHQQITGSDVPGMSRGSKRSQKITIVKLSSQGTNRSVAKPDIGSRDHSVESKKPKEVMLEVPKLVEVPVPKELPKEAPKEVEPPVEPYDPQHHIQVESQDKQRMQQIHEQIAPSLPTLHEQSLETLAPSGGSGEVKHDTITTAQGMQIYGPTQPNEEESKISPRKQAAANLGGMFAPLEVKFQDLTEFQKIAKKNFSGAKYPTISPREMPPNDQLEEFQTIPVSGMVHYGSQGSIHSQGSAGSPPRRH